PQHCDIPLTTYLLTTHQLRLKRHHSNLGPNTEAKPETESHTFVDVDLSLGDLIHAGGKTDGRSTAGGPGSKPVAIAQQSLSPLRRHERTMPSNEGPAESRPVDLTSVRMAAEHQVAAPSLQPLRRSWIVRQHDARHRRTQAL